MLNLTQPWLFLFYLVLYVRHFYFEAAVLHCGTFSTEDSHIAGKMAPVCWDTNKLIEIICAHYKCITVAEHAVIDHICCLAPLVFIVKCKRFFICQSKKTISMLAANAGLCLTWGHAVSKQVGHKSVLTQSCGCVSQLYVYRYVCVVFSVYFCGFILC